MYSNRYFWKLTPNPRNSTLEKLLFPVGYEAPTNSLLSMNMFFQMNSAASELCKEKKAEGGKMPQEDDTQPDGCRGAQGICLLDQGADY